jgi:hypothetical protein
VDAMKCKTRECTGMPGMGRQGKATECKRLHRKDRQKLLAHDARRHARSTLCHNVERAFARTLRVVA